VEELVKQLETLCTIPSVSGFEDAFTDRLQELVSPYVDSVERDRLGNLIAEKRGFGGEPARLLLDAHIDQIGLMIDGIEENGILRFTEIGGINPLTLYGKRVTLLGKRERVGVIGMLPPHLTAPDDKKGEPLHKLFVDAGFKSRSHAEAHVQIGDIAVVYSYSDRLLGSCFTGSGLDNKAGVLTLLAAASLLSQVKHYHDVYFLFAVQEEVGLRGARVGSYTIEPDVAVACDVTFADPGDSSITVQTGKGPVLGKGPNFYPPLVHRLADIAQREDIPTQEEIEPRPGGTDAYFLQVTKRGVFTAGVYIPLRYMHSQVEVIEVKDVYRAAKLLVQLSQEEMMCGETE
jgi:endoglucanase